MPRVLAMIDDEWANAITAIIASTEPAQSCWRRVFAVKNRFRLEFAMRLLICSTLASHLNLTCGFPQCLLRPQIRSATDIAENVVIKKGHPIEHGWP
jgi:hypothetical protein